MAKILVSVIAVILALQASAVSEHSLETLYPTEINPYFQSHSQRREFIGVDGVRISYFVLAAKNPKGVIILSPGQSEPAQKYAELLYDLRNSDYTFYVIDHRGQGYSGRMLPDSVKSHVNNFSDYVDDFSHFVFQIVKPRSYPSSFILGHSMGGTIVSGFLDRYPKSVTGVILSAPMLKINTGQYSQLSASLLASFLNLMGQGDMYAPGQKPYDPKAIFENTPFTASRARFNVYKNLLDQVPSLRVGGATVHWVKQNLRMSRILRRTDDLFQVPTLILQAENDSIVEPEGENEACERSSNFCSLILIRDSKHEILMETDPIRDKALSSIQEFLARHSRAQ